jgi:hypothetical protein
MLSTLATRVQQFTCLLAYHAKNSANCNTVNRGFYGNYTYIPSHCFSLGHDSDFRHQSASPHIPTWLSSLTTVQMVALFTLVTMVTMVYLQPLCLAWDMVPTLTTSVHHLWVPPRKSPQPLLCYHRSWEMQQCDFEVAPRGTTAVPNFIFDRPVVLGQTEGRDQPIMRSPNADRALNEQQAAPVLRYRRSSSRYTMMDTFQSTGRNVGGVVSLVHASG